MRRHALLASLLVAAVSLTASAKSKGPLFVAPSLDVSQIDGFDLFGINLSDAELSDAGVQGAVKGVIHGLEKRGYNDSGIKFRVGGAAPTDAMLNNPTSEWLQQLSDEAKVDIEVGKAPAEHAETSRWVMILTIDHMPGKPEGVFKLGTIALSLYIYDRSRPALLWHDHEEVTLSGGPAVVHIRAFREGAVYDQSLQLASGLAMKLPKRAKH